MLNRYEVVGDVAYLYLSKRGYTEEYVVKIDSTDLAKVLLKDKWYICTTNGLRAWTYFKDLDGNGHYVLLYRYLLDAPKDMTVDHINNDPLDNRRSNLRIVTQAANNQNHAGTRGPTYTGVRGVYYVPSRNNYTVKIATPEHRCKFFGYFDTLEEATELVTKLYKMYQPYSKQAQAA